jgi:hypothetical protein
MSIPLEAAFLFAILPNVGHGRHGLTYRKPPARPKTSRAAKDATGCSDPIESGLSFFVFKRFCLHALS